ncbi:hypothetical protein [Arthrobacter luteolus]|uniref:hypothetical protein n=1 Tax=Arthrobacter luteolus TaxID=98672 RepID=UPI00082A7957|nr:hypothetical protein [Arthrobacter luteolus]
MDWGDFWDQAAVWAITWIPVLGPLGILTTAVVAYIAYRQKLEADRRAQWWVRTQWALEASLSANPRRSLAGLAVLNDLKTSSLATREDRALFRLIALTVQDEVLGEEAVRGLLPVPDTGAETEPGAGAGTESGAGPDTEPSAGPGSEPSAGPGIGRGVESDSDQDAEKGAPAGRGMVWGAGAPETSGELASVSRPLKMRILEQVRELMAPDPRDLIGR